MTRRFVRRWCMSCLASLLACIPQLGPPLCRAADSPLVIGHRGAPRQEVGNTIASFSRAVAQGADAEAAAPACVEGYRGSCVPDFTDLARDR